MSHIFDKEAKEYNKYIRLNPLKEYVKQMASYISVQRNVSIEEATDFVRSVINNKEDPVFRNPKLKYYYRDLKTGDKEERETTLYSYIISSAEEGLIRVPSFTCYYTHDTKNSLLVGYLKDGIAYRSKYKKLALKADSVGDKEAYNKYNPQQLAAKKQNNSVSGLLSSRSTPLYNYSAHYTLTSMTRCVSSLGNGVSERVVANNKNYQTPTVVYGDILSNIQDTPYKERLVSVIEKFKLYKPTPKEVLHDILESTRFYWSDRDEENKILDFLQKLSAIDRAVFTYAGSLYCLKKYNPKLVRLMIDEFTTLDTIPASRDILKKAPAAVVNLTHHIRADMIEGLGTNYDDMPNDIVDILASTALVIIKVFSRYQDLLPTICASDVPPPNLANIKTMMRRAAILSDTDSTCTTYQEWVYDYFGEYVFSQRALSVSAVIMTLATETTGHYLQMLGATMNVPADKRSLLDMKNEFTWITMTPSNVSKHYFADTIVREGGVFKDGKLELKGAHFIGSLLPKPILDYRKKLIKFVHEEVRNNRKIYIRRLLKEIIDLETLAIDEITRGNPEYFNTGKINTENAYKVPIPHNPYIRHMFWNATFAKYGGYKEAPEPPYITISVPTTLATKAKVEVWLSTLSNKELAESIRKFMITYNKTNLSIIHINPTILNGIPEELIPIINVHDLVLKVMNPIYMIMENFGFYRKPGMLVKEVIQDF